MSSTTGKNFKASSADEARLASAVKKIAGDSDLRFFIRTYLEDLGVNQPHAGTDPMALARVAALQEAGMCMVGMLDSYDTMLYPAMLVEYHQEAALRRGATEEEEFPDEPE